MSCTLCGLPAAYLVVYDDMQLSESAWASDRLWGFTFTMALTDSVGLCRMDKTFNASFSSLPLALASKTLTAADCIVPALINLFKACKICTCRIPYITLPDLALMDISCWTCIGLLTEISPLKSTLGLATTAASLCTSSSMCRRVCGLARALHVISEVRSSAASSHGYLKPQYKRYSVILQSRVASSREPFSQGRREYIVCSTYNLNSIQ